MRELVGHASGRFRALAPWRLADGFAGTSVGASALLSEHGADVLAEVDAVGGLLFVHPEAGGPVPPGRPDWWQWTAGYAGQMQQAYLAWLGGLRDRYPEIRIVFAMLAGGAPIHHERLVHRGVHVRASPDPDTVFDTSSYGRRAIELCIETFGIERLVYGSDVPVIDPAPTLQAIHSLGDSVSRFLQSDTPERLLAPRPTPDSRHPEAPGTVSAIASWIANRLPANADLTPKQAGELACEIRTVGELWEPHVRHDETERFYAQLYRDPNVDIWLICWVEGQSTGYHDHDRSGGGVAVCDGVLHEDFFCRDEDGWIREQTRPHEPGGFFIFDSTYIHGVRHPGGSARARDVDPLLLTGALADGALRAGRQRHRAPRLGYVCRRAPRRCLTPAARPSVQRITRRGRACPSCNLTCAGAHRGTT